MNPVFADTAHWIAINSPADGLHSVAVAVSQTRGYEPDRRYGSETDGLHSVAVAVSQRLGSRPIWTSQMVLTEFLDGAATRGEGIRREAARFTRLLGSLPIVRVIPQTPELFAAALTLYEQRADKEWSLTDCASLVICQQAGIQDVLTHDKHFAQMGLNALLRTPGT